jgi:hypothetical protein
MKIMKCEDVELRMIDYLDNKLEEDIRLEIEKHLESCERCLDEMKDIQQVLNLMSEEAPVQAPESLRINFYHMLHSEIRKSQVQEPVVIQQSPWYSISRYRFAAAIALLICGAFIGLLLHTGNGRQTSVELAQLRSEVSDLKKATMLTMLKAGSSSERIQAVSYADELKDEDQNVIDVLVSTLNNDKNVNVRMAAAYALSKFKDQKSVSDSLVKSLSKQTDPILQVTLINILAERKEKSALKPIQEIISNKNTMKEVRAVAENSLRVLI